MGKRDDSFGIDELLPTDDELRMVREEGDEDDVGYKAQHDPVKNYPIHRRFSGCRRYSGGSMGSTTKPSRKPSIGVESACVCKYI